VKIYTKTGDEGQTALLGGKRVHKDDPRVEAYGDVDELNALLGVVRTQIDHADTEALLRHIQSDLFAIGSRLADPTGEVAARMPKTRLGPADVERLELAIDAGDLRLPALTSFILPGGSQGGAALHLARTVCRRAERRVIALGHLHPVEPLHVVYLNRLSDLLFVLARDENHRRGQSEDTW
jgi:cob(I)alamin adenosyltransferase